MIEGRSLDCSGGVMLPDNSMASACPLYDGLDVKHKTVPPCRAWPNHQTVTVQGFRFLQEDAPDAVGEAAARFVAKVLAGQIEAAA